MKKYRPDIDGLRALAVLPVVFFHANVPGFSGGFIGVDIFFVISGYLITSILMQELEEGSYSITKFYERRIRRIIPVLLLVLFFVSLASPLFMLPSEFRGLWKEMLGALFFFANIVFWLDSGYFSPDAETKPLLHTWSLGVEEQFYIVMPLILWLIYRYAKRHVILLIGMAILASLIACIFLTPARPSGSFYLLPTRAWELLVGSFLAAHITQRQNGYTFSQRFSEIAAFAGLLLILFSVFTYSSSTPFPGYAATLPVIGSALIIHYAQSTIVGRILSSNALVFIGLISYSLYLWHWPLVVIFRNLGWLDPMLGRASVIVTSFALAWLTMHYVERPTRNPLTFPASSLFGLTASGAVLLIIISFGYRQLDGWPSRVTSDVLAYDNARYDISSLREKCHINSGTRQPEQFCRLGSGSLEVAVWSDSHGVELAQALSERDLNVTSITYSSCPPEVSGQERSHRPDCASHNKMVLDYLVGNSKFNVIILVSFYRNDIERLKTLSRTASTLKAFGQRVIVVGPTPSLIDYSDLPTYLARGGHSDQIFHDLSINEFHQILDSSVESFFPHDTFCHNGYCNLLPKGQPLLFDGHHPSLFASRILAQGLASCIKSGSCRHQPDAQL